MKELSENHIVTPSISNACRELPLTVLVSQIIELATEHANRLEIGFIKLEPLNLGWVLSRLTVDMKRWPKCGEKYKLTTWIENWNRHFSERCFKVEDANGEIIGYVRTVWVVINLSTHASVGTGGLQLKREDFSGEECPISRQKRPSHFSPDSSIEYTFKYTDLDYYGHVNTVRYLELLLNQFDFDWYTTHKLQRFEIAFMHESKFGETATLLRKDELEERTSSTIIEINKGMEHILRSRLVFEATEV